MAALAGDWKEARKKCITTPDHDPAAFEGYLNWISSGQITLNEQRCKHCTPITYVGAACIEAQSLELVEMFILGDYLCDTRFCNAVTDSLKSVSLESYCVPSMSAVRCLWARTPASCPLRELFCMLWGQAFSHQSTRKWLEHQETPQEFILDLLLFVGKRYTNCAKEDPKRDRRQWSETCSFHRHVDHSDECE